MKKKNLIGAKREYNKLYYLFVNTLVGKLIKKGNRFSALKIYKKLRESIKVRMNKKKKVSFILFFAMLNSMPKVSFKEIRLGSQKKDVPISIGKKKQVLTSVETLLNTVKRNKKLNFDGLVECIILSYRNRGIIIKKKKIKYKKAIDNKILLNVFTPRYQKKQKPYVSKKIYNQIYQNKTAL